MSLKQTGERNFLSGYVGHIVMMNLRRGSARDGRSKADEDVL